MRSLPSLLFPQKPVSLKTLSCSTALTLALATVAIPALAEADPTTQELLKTVKALEERIRVLEAAPPAAQAAATQAAAAPLAVSAAPLVTSAPTPQAQSAQTQSAQVQAVPPVGPQAQPASKKELFGLVDSPIDGLKIGMYGEIKAGAKQNPSANGQWQNGFDAARIVLLPSYSFTDSIIFNSEIEFEHAGSGFDNDDKLHGTAEIEQAYVDFAVSPNLTVRSPGIDLVPIGYINQHHEPTLFYSVNRPELANGLIPTTWAAPSTGIYGKVADGLEYQLQFSSSLEDYGDAFTSMTDANRVPTGSYVGGIDGKTALTNSKAPLGDFRQLNNDIATALRLAYSPAFVPGLEGSTSGYFSPNITPRGAHTDAGVQLGRNSMTIADTELRYRKPHSGLELRGEYVQVFYGNPGNLRANNDSDATNNVGRTQWGVSGEVAWHVPLGQALGGKWEAVPFYRYTIQTLQGGGYSGTDSNAPTGSGRTQYHTVGVAVYPSPKLVLKLNYQSVIDQETNGARSDSVLGGVGFLF